VRPEHIEYVFCTHLHSDHCGWNTRLVSGRWIPTFPMAKYVFARDEYQAMESEISQIFIEGALAGVELWHGGGGPGKVCERLLAKPRSQRCDSRLAKRISQRTSGPEAMSFSSQPLRSG